MIRRLLSLLDDAAEAPALRRHIAKREAEIAVLRVSAAEAGTALREERADHGWMRERLAVAPTPETPIAGCWTLGGSDAALARAAGEQEEGAILLVPPLRSLADLGAMDATEVHRAKGCGSESMRRAARTLALSGVESHPSWARWIR